jgi:hypothetical protein
LGGNTKKQGVPLAIQHSFDIPDVADQLGVSTGTVSALIHSGELAAFSASKSPTSKKPRWRVLHKSLEEFIARRSVGPSVQPLITPTTRSRATSGDYTKHYEE